MTHLNSVLRARIRDIQARKVLVVDVKKTLIHAGILDKHGKDKKLIIG